jgi:squalene-hopene/tetraprenyl-beta-curcumene cyclase
MNSRFPSARLTAFRTAVIVMLSGSVLAADWSPRRAADYLDARQKSWFAWPRAAAPGGPCVSCHTGITYLLARPALRRVLGESGPTTFETGLVDGLKLRLEPGSKGMFKYTEGGKATQAAAVEAIIAALFVGTDRAYERMWSLQKQGSWVWFDLHLDPWEASHSGFFGAALAAVAAGREPVPHRNVAALAAYLKDSQAGQPLHNRLVLLWAAARVPAAAPAETRNQIIQDVLSRQQEDGGWTMASLGPFPAHTGAPSSLGSSAYATALAAFALQQGGLSRTDPRVRLALAWLRSHQDPESGSWRAVSLNRVYPAGSIEADFMSEAATAYAVLALLGSETSATAAAEGK